MEERLISASAKSIVYSLGWTTNGRTYSRTFSTLKEMAKFICKHPEREYRYIYEEERWIEERDNFMGFAGLHEVSCSKVTKDYLHSDIAWATLI